MFGPKVLVKPITDADARETDVYLPGGAPGQMHGQVKPLKVDRKYMWQHRSSRFHCLQEMVTNCR